MPALYLVLSPDLVIVEASDAYLRASMTERAAIVGRHILEVFPDNPDDPYATGSSNLRASLMRVVNEGVADTMAVQKYDIRKPESAGGGFEERFWSPLNIPIRHPDGHLAYVLHRAEDVTDFVRLKHGEREQAQLAEHLRSRAVAVEREVWERAQELQETNRKLRELQRDLEAQNVRVEAASKLKSEFLANMSHELRTPLNAILGFAELISNRAVSPDSAEHGEFVGHILASGRHLLQLINDILDLSKIEAGKMEFDPANTLLSRVTSEVIAILWPVAAERRITMHVAQTEVEHAYLDPARFKQILYNYLSNALKFTPAGGTVTVAITREGEHRFRLEVTDTGIGISEDDLTRLFVEFQQLDQGETKHHQGTGLGLALTRRIAEAQGGTVGVRSKRGEGSTFFVVLPIGRDPAREELLLYPSDAPDRTPSVLVVEDEAQDREAIVSVLRDAGYAVHEALTAHDAIAIAQEHRLDAVTIDLLLRDSVGLDVLHAIRAGVTDRKAPIVLVTVVSDEASVAGFAVHDVLSKPIDPHAVVSALERAGLRPDSGDTTLVVDDDPAALALMAAALGQLGFAAVCRNAPLAALEEVETLRPGAVIVDLLMPELDGLAFLERLRAMPNGGRVPAFLWTGKDLSREERARLAATAQGILKKAGEGSAALVADLRAALGRAGRRVSNRSNAAKRGQEA